MGLTENIVKHLKPFDFASVDFIGIIGLLYAEFRVDYQPLYAENIFHIFAFSMASEKCARRKAFELIVCYEMYAKLLKYEYQS